MLTYHISVCRQTPTSHIHYNIMMVKDSPLTDMQRIAQLSRGLGGYSAGQVVESLLAKRDAGFDLTMYGVKYVDVEVVPVSQICHKGEVDSPSIDWDTWLSTYHPVINQKPPAHPPYVGHIRHS